MPTNTLINILNNDILQIIISFCIFYLIFTFVIDNFKFSKLNLINIAQKFLFSLIALILIFSIFYFLILNNNIINEIDCAREDLIKTEIENSNPSMTAMVNLSYEAAKEIKTGLIMAGENLGLGVSIAGGAAAMSNLVSGSPAFFSLNKLLTKRREKKIKK